MTKAVIRSVRGGFAAALLLTAAGLCRTAEAAPTAFLNVNGVDIALKSVNSGSANVFQWKNDPNVEITNKIKGLENIAWSSFSCGDQSGIRLTLNKGLNNYRLYMASG